MIGKNIIHLSEVDSTNNYARGLNLQEVEEGTVVLAQYQKKGRGHLQNSWESDPGKNLTFSIILKPDFLNPIRQFALSQVVSLGILEFVNSKVEQASIKWPNDIYIGGKKIGGILIENSIIGSLFTESIVGVGLNINQQKFSEWIPNPTSLKLIADKEYNVEECLLNICSKISYWYEKLKNGFSNELNNSYLSHLYRLAIWAYYKTENKAFKGKIKGVDEIGRLMIENEDGKVLSFQFKEVEYVLDI